MNNNIQCSIESSTTKIELNSAVDGVFLVPELEGLVGLPEIRTTSGVNAGYDGGWTSAQNYDARLISIRGVIANPDISKVEDKRRAIASLLGQGRKEQLTLRFTTEAGNAYAISVRTISCEMALQRVLTTQEFLIQLRADDPLIYDDGTTGGIAAILQPQRALGGFEINFGLPLAIGGGAEDTVVDNGNETVYPVIKLYGALHSPTVVNRTTNQQMQILADLQYSIDWHTYRSATGDYILVSDGLNGAPMTLSQLTGNAEQTAYSGKNLARPNGNNTAAGVSFVWNSDGTITLNGTSTAAIDVWVANGGSGATEFTIPTGTKLTQSFRVVSGSASANTWTIRTNLYYGGASHWSDVVGNTTFTATSETQVRGLEVLAPSSGLTFNNLRLEIQLEKSATATTWEPYVGGTASPHTSYPQAIETVTGAQNVKVVGKNLFDMDDFLTTAGATYTKGGGQYSITAWGNLISARYPLQNIKTGNIYTISLDGVTQNTTNTRLQVYKNGSVVGTIYGGTDHQEHSYTFTADGSQYTVNATYSSPFSSPVIFRNPQLELGSTATAYEPYHGQSYEVNLGKNLLPMIDGTATIRGITATIADGVLTLNGTSTGSGIFKLTNGIEGAESLAPSEAWLTEKFPITNLNGTNIAIDYQSGTSPQASSAFRIYGSTSTHISQWYPLTSDQAAVWTSDTQAPSCLCFFFGNGITFNNYKITLQIERGSTATSYAPYFTPIELAKIGNYQDRIYKDDGKWYIEKQVRKVALDGAGRWFQVSSGIFYTDDISDYSRSGNKPLSDNFTSTTNVPSAGSVVDGTIAFGASNLGTQNRFYVKNTTIGWTSEAVFKQWLTDHPTTVYYALATPTTTEITDETLLAQLNFLASLYDGENNISLMGTGAQGEMAISYATANTVNQDVITIDSQARTITLNGQDVYHLKTSESEFLVLAPGENKLYLTSEVSDDSGYAEVKFKQGYLSI